MGSLFISLVSPSRSSNAASEMRIWPLLIGRSLVPCWRAVERFLSSRRERREEIGLMMSQVRSLTARDITTVVPALFRVFPGASKPHARTFLVSGSWQALGGLFARRRESFPPLSPLLSVVSDGGPESRSGCRLPHPRRNHAPHRTEYETCRQIPVWTPFVDSAH